jgi:hypothetical protein
MSKLKDTLPPPEAVLLLQDEICTKVRTLTRSSDLGSLHLILEQVNKAVFKKENLLDRWRKRAMI